MVRKQSPGSFQSSLGFGEGQGIPLPRCCCWELTQTPALCFSSFYSDALIAVPGPWCLRKRLWAKVTMASKDPPDAGGTLGERAGQHPNSHVPAPPIKLMFLDSGGLEAPGQFPHIQITGTFLIGLW